MFTVVTMRIMFSVVYFIAILGLWCLLKKAEVATEDHYGVIKAYAKRAFIVACLCVCVGINNGHLTIFSGVNSYSAIGAIIDGLQYTTPNGVAELFQMTASQFNNKDAPVSLAMVTPRAQNDMRDSVIDEGSVLPKPSVLREVADEKEVARQRWLEKVRMINQEEQETRLENMKISAEK